MRTLLDFVFVKFCLSDFFYYRIFFWAQKKEVIIIEIILIANTVKQLDSRNCFKLDCINNCI